MPGYGFATLIGDYPVGYEFSPDSTPLHLTHIDSFDVDLDAEALTAKLQNVASMHQAFNLKALASVFYGPNKDIPVTTLELTPELAALHAALMGMLAAEGATIKRPEFNGEFFSPHVSACDDRRIMVGETVQINDISIGIKTGEGAEAVHTIVATVNLSDSDTLKL